jgi:hypothetical protein
LYNYADDNTLSYVNDNYEKLIDILEKESSVLIDWFKFNCMQANPDKFQAIAVGNKTHAKTPVFKIESDEITCDEVAKLLAIDVDYQLNFNYLKTTKSCKQDGESLFKILKHSIAMVRILLTFRDGTLAFSNNSSYVLS